MPKKSKPQKKCGDCAMHHANTAYCSLFGESKKKGSKACDQFTDGKVTRKPKKKETGRPGTSTPCSLLADGVFRVRKIDGISQVV